MQEESCIQKSDIQFRLIVSEHEGRIVGTEPIIIIVSPDRELLILQLNEHIVCRMVIEFCPTDEDLAELALLKSAVCSEWGSLQGKVTSYVQRICQLVEHAVRV